MNRSLLAVALAALTCQAGAGLFGPAGDDSAEKRATILKQRDAMLSEMFAAKPELRESIKKAAGYATFNQKDVNLFLLASGNGYGVLVENPSGKEVFMRMASLGGGIGMGVKDVRVLFVFRDPQVMKQFVEQGWVFGGKADAAAAYEGKGVSAEQNVKAAVDFTDGTVAAGSSTDARAATDAGGQQKAAASQGGPMEVYQFTESGLALQATVAGTKYWKDSKLNQ